MALPPSVCRGQEGHIITETLVAAEPSDEHDDGIVEVPTGRSVDGLELRRRDHRSHRRGWDLSEWDTVRDVSYTEIDRVVFSVFTTRWDRAPGRANQSKL